MGRKKTVTKKPSYFEAIAWIANNDATGDDNNLEAIKLYVTVCMVADLFGCEARDVAIDVQRHRAGAGRGHIKKVEAL